MSGWQNVSVTQCLGVKMSVRQNVKVSKCWGVKMSRLQNVRCRDVGEPPQQTWIPMESQHSDLVIVELVYY